MNRNRPTLSDIAARTGFGTNTVSLALRNSTRISKETRETIQAAAHELDYVPNYVAKSLALDRTHTYYDPIDSLPPEGQAWWAAQPRA